MSRVYQSNDLFYSDWKQLNYRVRAQVFSMHQHLLQQEQGSLEYGYGLIAVMRQLRKNKRLVDKANEAQVVDMYNERKEAFLTKPWYDFPRIKNWKAPEDKMAHSSFDQFIYADNEFTSYLATEDPNYLKRLAATLYLLSEIWFDKERVDSLSGTSQHDGKLIVNDELPPMRFKQHELQLIFFTFMHVREFVVKRCKHLLPPSPPQEGENKAKPSGAMWHEIKHSAARTLVFGSFEELGKANMYDVLDHLELLAKPKQHANA